MDEFTVNNMEISKQVLVVEDDLGLLSLITKSLAKEGYEVFGVSSGAEAIEKINQNRNLIVLLDQSLPDMTGHDIISELHEQEINFSFIVITGQGDERLAVEMMKLGASDYLVKDTYFLEKLPEVIKRVSKEIENKSKRKQAEKALIDSELKYQRDFLILQSIFESPVSIVVFSLDKNYCYTSFTTMHKETIKNIWGVDISIGMNMLNIISNIDDRKKAKINFDKALNGEHFTITEEYGDTNLSRLVYENHYNPVKNQKGLIVGLSVYVIDVTESKKIQTSLIASEEKYRIITDSTLDIIFMTDKTGKLLFMNESTERVLGYKVEEVVGKSFAKFVQIKDIPKYFSQLKNLFIQKEIKKFITQIYHKDGHLVDVEINGRLIKQKEKYVGLGTIRDISERKRVEDELKKSNEFNSSLLKTIPFGMDIIDQEGNLIFISENIKSQIGKNAIRKKCWDVYRDDKTQCEACPIKNEIVIGETSYLETDKVMNGRTFLITHTGMLFEGQPVILEVFQDITKRKQAEEKLITLNMAIDQNPASIVITNPEGEIEYVNPKFCEVTGYSFEEAIGNNPRILKTDERRKEEYKDLWETISSGKTWHGEFQNKKKDGSLYWESASISPILNEKGKTTHFVAVKEDITEKVEKDLELKNYRENLEQLVDERTKLLKKSEETFRALAENSEDTIMRFDNNCRHLYVNPVVAEQTGILQSEFIGENHKDLGFPEDLIEIWESAIEFVFENKKKNRIEFLLPNDLWIDWTVLPEFDLDNNVNSVLAFGRDITKRKVAEVKMEVALEKEKDLNELKDQFLSTVSHDLRTPLTSIYSSVELIEAFYDEWEKEKVVNKFGQIKSSVSRITDMLNHVLELSKIERGKVSVNLNMVNLLNECKNILEEVTPHKGENHELKLNYNLEKEDCSVDVNLLREILINLLTNGLKYSPNGGKVVLSVGNRDNLIMIEVSDEGIGMTENDIEKVFNKFYRAEESQNISGSGLGLSIVKHYVEMYKGKIEVESELGKGSTFRILIPENIV